MIDESENGPTNVGGGAKDGYPLNYTVKKGKQLSRPQP
jgi:hypothetical protein